ncbi:unnamed protein product [Schistocephalus solidus]|uniref:BESS domain-containing protein n=1 Tax=Schistocephalus solidus TaxID=70667 RepID=A0A183SSU6_SCHSO|nr:unnamed protein product [Schistocephalus solidus]
MSVTTKGLHSVENDELVLEGPDPRLSPGAFDRDPFEDGKNEEEDADEGAGGGGEDGGGGGGLGEKGEVDGDGETEQDEEEDEMEIDYNTPFARFLCCYFFPRQPPKDTGDKEVVLEENRRPEQEAKAARMAKLLYFKDDVEAESRKAKIQMDLVDLQRPPVPLSFRLYDFAKPASEEYTFNCLRQEARLALCSTLEGFQE